MWLCTSDLGPLHVLPHRRSIELEPPVKRRSSLRLQDLAHRPHPGSFPPQTAPSSPAPPASIPRHTDTRFPVEPALEHRGGRAVERRVVRVQRRLGGGRVEAPRGGGV